MSKKYKDKINTSTFIRTFYAPGFSSITVSYYGTCLSLRFYQWTGKNNIGFSIYDLKNGMTTTINPDGASYLYLNAMSIIKDINPEKEVTAVLNCNKAALVFEYKRDQDNQMVAYLTIDKNNRAITFRFSTHTCQVKIDGQKVTKIIQSGLGAFAKTLDGYLTGIGADIHLSKLPENYQNSPDDNQQGFNTTENSNDGYQQGFNSMGNNQQGYQQENKGGYQGNYGGYGQ